MSVIRWDRDPPKRAAAAERWRRLLFSPARDSRAGGDVPEGGAGEFESAIEATAAGTVEDPPEERITRAREAMRRLVRDRFGGDPSLLKAVEDIAFSGEEALAVLTGSRSDEDLDTDQLASLEAIVAFDGTRPSFLVKDNSVDFASSYNTSDWPMQLSPLQESL